MEKLPLQDLIQKGIKKLNSKKRPDVSLETLLVSIGAPKLRSSGFEIKRVIRNPEMKLYDLLSQRYPPDRVHSLYNSYIRRLVSFERSLCLKRRTEKK